MNQRFDDLCGPRRTQRRSTRLRAGVEALDPRRLMAVGVTGTAVPVSGSANFPLLTTEYNIPPVIGLGGFLPSIAPVGTPIPLVSLTNASDSLSASGYSGTVDWGDGSPVDTALFGNFILTTPLPLPTNPLLVSGPDHTYAQPGTYPITVAVTGPGDPAPTVYTDTATIGPALTITGQLNPLSDSGVSSTDEVTAINTPNFFGTTQPGATVELDAEIGALGYNVAVPVGSGVADAAGNWSITTIPMADGDYSILARATLPSGVTALAGVSGNPFAFAIDTAGPKLTNFQVLNAKTGTFTVEFTDSYGLDSAPLGNASLYVVGRPSPTPRKGQKFPVTSLAYSTRDTGSSIVDALQVTATVGTGKPLITRNGVDTFTIRSATASAAGIDSLSGAALDGEYTGKFPTGNGHAGGDFQVKVNVRNGKASRLIAITPVKVVVRHHR